MDISNGGEKNQQAGISSAAKNPKAPLALSAIILFLLVIGWAYYFSGPGATPTMPVSAQATFPAEKPSAEPTAKPALAPIQNTISLAEAEKTYLVVRQAMVNRDYAAYANVASSYSISQLQKTGTGSISDFHKMHSALLTDSGLNKSYELPSNITPIEYFEMFSPELLRQPYFAPNPRETVVLGYHQNTAQADFPFRSNAVVEFRAKDYNNTGLVGFVLEGGQQKFVWDSWLYRQPPAGASVGDAVPAGTEPHILVCNNSGSDPASMYPPKTLRIKAGEYVSWQNITGYLFSYMPAAGNFSSGLLTAGTFTHQFNAPGAYFYTIRRLDIPNWASIEFVGVVVVE